MLQLPRVSGKRPQMHQGRAPRGSGCSPRPATYTGETVGWWQLESGTAGWWPAVAPRCLGSLSSFSRCLKGQRTGWLWGKRENRQQRGEGREE